MEIEAEVKKSKKSRNASKEAVAISNEPQAVSSRRTRSVAKQILEDDENSK
jgi:hypothetical protein